MVTELQDLLRRNVEGAPPDQLDLNELVAAGRRRVRRRQGAVGALTLASVGVLATAVLAWPGAGHDGAVPASVPPAPDAPTITLADATDAVEGRDYDVIATYTNDNLDRDNGTYLRGVTDDGLVLVQDGPSDATGWETHLALMDPATRDQDPLPDPGVGQANLWPIDLGADRLLFLDDNATGRHYSVLAFDRAERTWSTLTWPSLPRGAGANGAQLGPDGRLYVRTPATQGTIPEGGWPTGNGGEADDSDAEGDTYHLWSVSLTDPDDVRDEQLTLGSLAFTDTAMVWTDRTNGDAGQVHVRDLATGDEQAFDPHAGDRCNLLSFGAYDDRIVMGQYCGDYGGDGDAEVRDDRVQILSTDGDQVVTLQDDGLDGGLSASSGVVSVSAYGAPGDGRSGAYAYDLATDRLLRLSDGVSHFALGGTVNGARQVLWDTPVGQHGAKQWIADLTD